MRLSSLLLVSVVATSAVNLAGCGGRNGDGAGASASSTPRVIEVDGSSTVYRISKAAQEAYSEVDPNVTVVVNNHGTGGGFGRYLQGEVDIVDASRDAKPDETAKSKAQGIEWTRYLVGYDGITLVVNPKNTFVKSLTVDQLKAIWSASGKVKTWKDVDPSWPDQPIVLYCPDQDSGTFEFFKEAILGKDGAQRDDVQPSSDDNTLVTGVAGDVNGLGYFGYAYYASNTDSLRAVPIQNGADAKPVMPSPETVLDKSYAPLSRPLYIFVKNSAGRRPEVAAFVKFYLDKIGTLAPKGGYVAPTADDQAANAKTLAATSASSPATN
jgi:phosphate transport system substrate-binding protein